jgi:hypothetical protein
MKLSGDRKLGLLVALAFGVLLSAWTILFSLAAKNRVASVPLGETRPVVTATSSTPAPH